MSKSKQELEDSSLYMTGVAWQSATSKDPKTFAKLCVEEVTKLIKDHERALLKRVNKEVIGQLEIIESSEYYGMSDQFKALRNSLRREQREALARLEKEL